MKVCQGYRPIIEEGTIKKGLKKIIEKCWSAEPKERSTFSELYRKLSLSKDDYFLEFEKNDLDSNVIESDDDDGIENDDEFTVNKKYCLENVECDILFDYIDEINEEPTSLTNKEQQNEMKEMAEKISSLESELQKSKSEAKTLKKQNEKMKSEMEKMASKISLLESNVSKMKNDEPSENSINEKIDTQIQKKIGLFICAEPSLTEPGILYQLKAKEKSNFDQLFIASRSSNDPYHLIDPKTKDEFGSNGIGDFWRKVQTI